MIKTLEKMEDNPLQKHFVILCQELNLEKVLPYLRAERMVTPDEYETLISASFNTRQKREKLLLLLPRKGRQYFQNFGKCLVWSGQTDLARHIGIDVLSVPESPHPAPSPGGPELSQAQIQAAFTNILQDMTRQNYAASRNVKRGSSPQQKAIAPDQLQQLPPEYSNPPPSYHTYPPHQHPPTCNATMAMGPYYPPAPNGTNAPTQYPGPPNVTMATGPYPGPPVVTMAARPYPGPPNVTTATGQYPHPSNTTNFAPSHVPYNAQPTTVAAHGNYPPPNVSMATGVPITAVPYHHPQSNPYQQHPTPRSTQAQGSSCPPRRAGNTKVFILYCKDTQLQAQLNKTADEFCDDVLALADILRFSGVETFIDQYGNHPGNWDGWTQRMIEQSDHVLMVCSPQLWQSLYGNEENITVEMSKGKFFSHGVANSVSAPKFVPVFLDNCISSNWIPPSLRMTSSFQLNISELTPLLDVEDGMPSSDQLVRTKLQNALTQDQRFVGFVNLVRLLRQDTDAPPPVLEPFTLPTSSHAQLLHGGISPSYPHAPTHPIPAPRSHLGQNDKGEPEYISKEDLTRIAEVVPRDWQHLGIKLGVEYTKLEALRAKHPFDSTLATLEMFRLWQSKKGKQATRKALKQALIELNFVLIAREVFGSDK